MLTPLTLAKATAYWASELSCPPAEMFADELRIMPHGPALADYHGIFALFREDRAMISMPPDRMAERLPTEPALFAAAFSNFRVIGPAFIGYADTMRPGAAEELNDPVHARRLQAACDETAWDHGGSEVGAVPCSGVFADGELAALAGYEVWTGSIAHISIVTHPRFRGRGYGREAVAHLACRALEAGLVPQYRTLEANLPSMRIATALGFRHYASSVAVRWE